MKTAKANKTEKTSPQENLVKKINVALQGGGAHGAFGWGVLDKIIEDGRLEIDGVCGTSAGAMNGVLYAYGKMKGGPEHAREVLENFWHDISKTSTNFFAQVPAPFGDFLGAKIHEKIMYSAFDIITLMFLYYEYNPFNFNPLREILEKNVNFKEIHACQCTNIFVCATNARTGQPKIFGNHEITADTVLASACLPFLFQTIVIDGEPYWDGGYVGNPALYPMIYKTDTLDFVIVHINPIERPEVPHDAQGILNRVNEVSFNSSLIGELRAIAFVQKIIKEDWIRDEHKHKLKEIRVHAIRSDKEMLPMEVNTKFSTDWGFLQELRDLGRIRAKTWLEETFDKIGNTSSLDIRESYL